MIPGVGLQMMVHCWRGLEVLDTCRGTREKGDDGGLVEMLIGANILVSKKRIYGVIIGPGLRQRVVREGISKNGSRVGVVV